MKISIPYSYPLSLVENSQMPRELEVLMSYIMKYTSKSMYVKSLSKTKNKVPSSKHLFSQSSNLHDDEGTYPLSSPQGQ